MRRYRTDLVWDLATRTFTFPIVYRRFCNWARMLDFGAFWLILDHPRLIPGWFFDTRDRNNSNCMIHAPQSRKSGLEWSSRMSKMRFRISWFPALSVWFWITVGYPVRGFSMAEPQTHTNRGSERSWCPIATFSVQKRNFETQRLQNELQNVSTLCFWKYQSQLSPI